MKRYTERDVVQGTRVELEHTGDAAIARQIALDHLEESPRYYQELAKMERKLGRNPPSPAKRMTAADLLGAIGRVVQAATGQHFSTRGKADLRFWCGELTTEEAEAILRRFGPDDWEALSVAYPFPQELLANWVEVLEGLARYPDVRGNPEGPYKDAFEDINRRYNALRKKLERARSEEQRQQIARQMLSLAVLRKEAQWGHKQTTSETLRLYPKENPEDNPEDNPYFIRDRAGRVWDGAEWRAGGRAEIYERVYDMPRELPSTQCRGELSVRPDMIGRYYDRDGEVDAEVIPLGLTRKNPGKRLVDAYVRFHGTEPSSETAMAKAWVPGSMVYLGPCIDIGYYPPASSRKERANYVHDTKSGVKVYCRPDASPVDAEATRHYRHFPQELWVLGANIGFSYEDRFDHQEYEVKGSSARKLACNESGKMLVVVDNKGVLFIVEGGNLYVKDWIYN